MKKKKKKATLKFKIFTFLLSHTYAWTNVEARTTILKALEGITESTKTSLVVPLLREALQTDTRTNLSMKVEVDVVGEYCRLVLQPFEGASRKWIEASENEALSTFVQVLEIEDVTGTFVSSWV